MRVHPIQNTPLWGGGYEHVLVKLTCEAQFLQEVPLEGSIWNGCISWNIDYAVYTFWICVQGYPMAPVVEYRLSVGCMHSSKFLNSQAPTKKVHYIWIALLTVIIQGQNAHISQNYDI